MRRITWQDRWRYTFDNIMARGPIAMIAWLFLLSALIIVAIALIVTALGLAPAVDDSGARPNFPQLLWMGLMRTLDSGTMGGDTGGWPFLFAMLAVTIGGIFVVSSLIGIISSGLESKLTDMRKGRSFVIEQHHTLILGWSPQIFSILSELVLANANQRRAAIVVLADRDKVEMEDDIRGRIGPTGRTRIVCRSGSPIDLSDLEIANPHASKSIIVLAPEVNDPDSHVIKTVLAITNNPRRRTEPYHIVAEVRDERNLEAARLVGKSEAHFVLAGDLISRITVQTCRQSGLSVVYTELLDFGGDEIYFHRESALVGKTFRDAVFHFDTSSVMGLFRDGAAVLNPPSETVIAASDQLVVISEDDDTIKASGLTPSLDASAIVTAPIPKAEPERTLILGWNRRGLMIVQELEQYVAAGSSLTVVADLDEIVGITEGEQNRKQTVTFQRGDTTDRRTLDALDPTRFNHVIVLAYSDSLEPQQADARTLVTLLHLREIADRSGRDLSVVSEMLDNRNRELAEVTKADDFIVSDKLISLMLSQVSENKGLADVFRYLFSADGSELYLKPADQYVKPGQSVNFYTVLEAARLRGEVAIGYRLQHQAHDASAAYGVRVNPVKSQSVSFKSADRIIVLAES